MWNFPLAPDQASTYAGPHDALFYTITALTVLFTLIVFIAVIFLTVRYRRGTKVNRLDPVHEHLALELTWSIIPLILALGIFFWSTKNFIDVRTPPKDAMDIFVMGKQWMWHVQHPNGVRENNSLHVPVGRPVRLIMISQDVIHAFYIPEFRVQYMVVPGRYTYEWFQATKPGTYHLFCNMYCGTQHAEMGGTVTAMSERDYAQWLQNQGESVGQLSSVERGALEFDQMKCNNCHTDHDTERGPSLNGIAGTMRKMSNGSTVKADLVYLRESILRPWDRLTAGYGPAMPMYQGEISEEDVVSLIDYVASLGSAQLKPQMASDSRNLGTVSQKVRKEKQPRMAVGALGSEEEKSMGNPKPRALAVGSLADDGKGR
ncbi:MAG: cytochrome c oxidase subunit II [Armatimonadetes bacterium]|nr:cytochrome c oxidase subunit II [Armatimonadota bacterium]